MAKPQGLTINGPVLQFARERVLDLSVAEAARRVDVTPSMWSKWENGTRRISSGNLQLICDLLELDDPTPLLASAAYAAEAEVERNRARRNRTLGVAA